VHEFDNAPPSTADVKNERSYTDIPPEGLREANVSNFIFAFICVSDATFIKYN
jgi:hypothetical protein